MNHIPLIASPTGEATHAAEVDPDYAVGATRCDIVTDHWYGGRSTVMSMTIRGEHTPVECAIIAAEQMHRLAMQRLMLANTLLKAAYDLRDPAPVHRRAGQGQPGWKVIL